MDTGHPCSIDVAVLIHVVIPSDRHADSTKASILHHAKQFGFGRWLPPAVFRLKPLLSPVVIPRNIRGHGLVVSLEGITQIPTNAHILHGFGRRLKISGCSMGETHQEQTS